jgi:hypothetical protein
MTALQQTIESDEDIESASVSSDENEGGDEIDPSFEFGGILVSVDRVPCIADSRAVLCAVGVSFFLNLV